jgi:hypothetical protein
MARRPHTPDPARVSHGPAARLAPVIAVAATLALSACSVTVNPGPGEAAFEMSAWQIGEAAAPVRNAVTSGTESGASPDDPTGPGSGPEDDSGPEDRTVAGGGPSVADGVESGTIDVRPAPRSRADDAEADGGTSSDTDDAADGGPAGDDGGTGARPAGNGNGNGGSGADGGTAEAGISDAVRYARALEAEVNQRREAHGLPALAHDGCAYDEALDRAGALRGRDLAHAPLETIFGLCPTSTVGENLARGGWSPAEAADGWMNSEGHRANILNPAFSRGAIACIAESTTYGWQMTCAHVFLG